MKVRVSLGGRARNAGDVTGKPRSAILLASSLGPSEVEMRCDVSTSGQVAEGFHGSRPMWVCGCDVECRACVLHGGSDLDGEAQRGGAVPCWSSRRGAGELKRDREPGASRVGEKRETARPGVSSAARDEDAHGRECHSQRQGIPDFHATTMGRLGVPIGPSYVLNDDA